MSHLKRLNSPKSWNVLKKTNVFILKARPGPHKKADSIPLGVILRDMLKFASNLREVKKILFSGSVLVDGVTRKDHKFPVGLFDVIEIKEAKGCFRVLKQNGKLVLHKIMASESVVKPCRIIGKVKSGKKTQVNLYDGKNIIVDTDDYKVGDTLLIELPSLAVKGHFRLDKGSVLFLADGKHEGSTGTITAISKGKLQYKNDAGQFETLKKYAYIIGGEKAAITLPEDKTAR